MNGQILPRGGARRYAFLLASAALLVFAIGCYRATRSPGPEGAQLSAASSAPESSATRAEETAPSRPPSEQPAPAEGPPPAIPAVSTPTTVPEEPPAEPLSDSSPFRAEETPRKKEEPPAVSQTEKGKTERKTMPGEGETVAAVAPQTGPAIPAPRSDAEEGTVVVARLSEERAFPQNGPFWARRKEELVYRVEFLGITMGYARFSFLGKVLLYGKEAYHLRVRAWTSDLLSVIYPMDDTIDYYLDDRTMAPLRQEHKKSKKEDDVAIYDQEKGTIVYRYKKDGRIRKKVDAVPNVYDPVSVAYYYRTRDPEGEEKAMPMYAGRKLWEISAKPVGFERIRTDGGEFDTIIVQPVLRREGKLDERREMRMWMTKDERHVPVRLYAKFKKIRTWTLVGELLPDQQGG